MDHNLSTTIIKQFLIQLGFHDVKTINKTKLAIIVRRDPQAALQKVNSELKELNPKITKRNDQIKEIYIVPFTITARTIAEDANKARKHLAAGISNELAFVNTINEIIRDNEGPIDIAFNMRNQQKFAIENVRQALAVGRKDQGQRKKADALLLTTQGKRIPISLKKDDAKTWESADSIWKESAKYWLDQLIQEVKIELKKRGNGYEVVKNFAVKATSKEVADVVFGSDILAERGAVVVKTFVAGDFSFDADTDLLTITTSNVILRPEDVHDNVWFIVRNDSSRHTVGLPPGIRVLAVTRQAVQYNVIQINSSKRA